MSGQVKNCPNIYVLKVYNLGTHCWEICRPLHATKMKSTVNSVLHTINIMLYCYSVHTLLLILLNYYTLYGICVCGTVCGLQTIDTINRSIPLYS